MRTSLVDYYARMADRQAYGYQTYGGDAAIASLRVFRAYHPHARYQMIDGGGRQRWMTATMMRIHAILSRESMRPNGELVKIRDMAREAQASPGYFAKVLERFTAWDMFASISVRGRKGGIYLWARTAGDTFARYGEEARQWLYQKRINAAVRFLRKTEDTWEAWRKMFPPIHTGVLGSTEETFSEGDRGGIRTQSTVGAGMAGHHGPAGRVRDGFAAL